MNFFIIFAWSIYRIFLCLLEVCRLACRLWNENLSDDCQWRNLKWRRVCRWETDHLSHNFTVYISKLFRKISNQISYIFSHIVFDNLITSFININVVCIIDCNNIIKILSILQCIVRKSVNFLSFIFCRFRFLDVVDAVNFTSILFIWLWKTFISFYFIFRFISLSLSVCERLFFCLLYESTEKLSQQIICNSFWRQFSTRSFSLRDSFTTFCKSITFFARYSTILIDVRWKFWSLKFSNFSKFESAILFIHFNESTTSFRFKTFWFNFVLISNVFAIRTFFETFWSNFQL